MSIKSLSRGFRRPTLRFSRESAARRVASLIDDHEFAPERAKIEWNDCRICEQFAGRGCLIPHQIEGNELLCYLPVNGYQGAYY